MRPRVLLVAALVVAAVACSSSPPDPYAAYRQTQIEDVPGTLDWQIGPVPSDYRAAIGPADAYDELFTAGDRKHAYAILAEVTNTTNHTVGPPAWVFVTPHTCYATAKGDLVSPGRTGDGCTDENLYVQGVNATTGERLGGFTAFDTPTPWVPAREGTPPVVEAKVQAGTTLLH
jgi:hypothetical protein